MALSSDERRTLADIRRHLADDDPLFATRMAAGQRHMRFRAAIPFYRPLCFLLATAALVIAMVFIGALNDDDAEGVPSAPSQVADDRLIPMVEPR